MFNRSRLLFAKINEFAAPRLSSQKKIPSPSEINTDIISEMKNKILDEGRKACRAGWNGLKVIGPTTWGFGRAFSTIKVRDEIRQLCHHRTIKMREEVSYLCLLTGDHLLLQDLFRNKSAVALGVAGAYISIGNMDAAKHHILTFAPTNPDEINQFDIDMFLHHLFYRAMHTGVKSRACLELALSCHKQLPCRNDSTGRYVAALAHNDDDKSMLNEKFVLGDEIWNSAYASVSDTFKCKTNIVEIMLRLRRASKLPPESMEFVIAFGNLSERIRQNKNHPTLADLISLWQVSLTCCSGLGSTPETLHVNNAPLLEMYMEVLASYIASPAVSMDHKIEASVELESKFSICLNQTSDIGEYHFGSLQEGLFNAGREDRLRKLLLQCYHVDNGAYQSLARKQVNLIAKKRLKKKKS